MDRRIRTYLRHLPAITACMDAQGVPFYFSNPLFILSRLAKSPNFRVRRVDGGLLVEGDDKWRSVLPTTKSRARYLAAVEAAARPDRVFLRLPAWMRPAIGGRVLAPLWPDYICNTAALQSMAGRKFKSIRQWIGRAERSGRAEVIRLGPEHAADAAVVAHDWYRAREPVLETMWLERENVWLFEQLEWLYATLPGFWATGVKVDGRLEAVNLSCPLSDSMWCCHTERYRPGALTHCNQLAFREACRAVDPAVRPWVNDGPADGLPEPGVNNLASFKARLADHTLVPYGLFRQAQDAG